ncbi:MAG: NADH-quinone oxidoreductase subunit N [Chloroflexi bacterium]|nr:NADH-quinone oxidoreductase subunit N [Chloroflexota bacterium]MCI0577240.1 NADH-quinone oxidoreductase subunit N [Chloroflexota bacterium]MCI0646721.1 NADH-quinone oxidoreductase subunit N [Chloroflexota bacterium]MCI0731355.1 NADH-quinone oxidoreductase subunit N [Chloroflexota bacterium]
MQEFQAPSLNLLLVLPFLIVAGWATLLMVVDLFIPEDRKRWLAWLSLAGIVAAFIQTAGLWGYNAGTFTPAEGAPMLLVDNYSNFLNAVFLLTGFLTVLISVNYLSRTGLQRGEYYYLMLFSISGMMLMGMANDLILVFLALELLSIPLYVLSGFARPRLDSEESAMKYFLLGAFSSGFLVFGIALVYGATGSTALPAVLATIGESGALGLAGAALLLVGFAFKVAAVPFHMWTPDVYEGAPTAVTAFMSVGAKVGGFAAMIRVFLMALPDLGDNWVPAVAIIAALTMILGNLVALTQQNIKRMLAYSSIAHAGYIMIGVAAAIGSDEGVSAALFYMLAYLFTNLGAFAVVIAVERQASQGLLLDDYRGLARRSPLLALALAYFMLSLTGVPPTGGFYGKFVLFRAALEANLLWLTIVGVVTSVISGYFYLRIVYYAYMYEGEGEVTATPALNLAVLLAAVATFLLGVLPAPWYDLARQAIFTGTQVLAGG